MPQSNDPEIDRLIERATKGHDPEALFELGFAYKEGNGVPQDDAEAIRWLKLGAEQGCANAQLMLGMIYKEGDGVPQNDVEALRWFHLAAEQGDSRVQFILGNAYLMGEGVPENTAEAIKWFTLSAEQGEAHAQHLLGHIFADGMDVGQDYKEALRWWTLAAEQGHADSQFELGCMYEDGNGVQRNEDEAKQWWTLAAEQGHDEAQTRLDETEPFNAGAEMARIHFEDQQAIGRAGALLLLLKAARPKDFKKHEIMSAGLGELSPLYAVRRAGLFGSKPAPGFSRGRMVEVEQQLRAACEGVFGRPITDDEIELAVNKIEMSPLYRKM